MPLKYLIKYCTKSCVITNGPNFIDTVKALLYNFYLNDECLK